MTTITARPTSGREISVGHLDLPAVDDRTEPMLPAPIRKARAAVLDLTVKDAIAQGAVFTTHEAIAAAAKADAQALGAAMLAGKADPGPVHTNKAHAAHDEAKRQAAGIASALSQAQHHYWQVTRDTDRTTAVAAVDALADEVLAPLADMLQTVVPIITDARGLRALAASLDTFPAKAREAAHVDLGDVTRAVATIRAAIDALNTTTVTTRTITADAA